MDPVVEQNVPVPQVAPPVNQSPANNSPINPDGSVVLQDKYGRLFNVDQDQAKQALQSKGWSLADPKAIEAKNMEAKYSTLGQQAKTFGEGAAAAATFGGSTGVETALGVDPEDIRNRREVNPGVHMAGQIGGLAATSLLPGVGEAAAGKAAIGAGETAAKALTAVERINPLSAQSVMSGLGEGAAAKLGLAGEGVLGGAAKGAAQAAVEGAIFQSGDEVSKMLSEDPDQSLQTAIANVGLAGLIGGGIGAPIGAISPLFEATGANKLGQFVSDFKGRINEHLNNPNPSQSLSEELGNYYTSTRGAADEIYGPKGLKSQEIHKVMPQEMTMGIREQASELTGRVRESIDSMKNQPEIYPPRLTAKLENDLAGFHTKTAGNESPAVIFDELQRMKQKVQDFSEYKNHTISPTDDRYDFVQKMRSLAPDFKGALEDEKVWGAAAKRQNVINKAFSEYLPTLKDFEKKFTTTLGEEKIIDPAKVNTYVNQLGKPNAEIKQSALQSFIDASEKYRKVIGDTHSNLGVENPITPASLNHSMQSLEKLTPGAKTADAFVKKGVTRLAGEGAGAAVGGTIGHFMGSPLLGALVGEHALGPFFSSILPSLIKPLLESNPSGAAFKGAIDYAMQVVKGETLLNKAAKNVFTAGRDVVPSHLLPDEKALNRLDKKVQMAMQKPEDMIDMGGEVGHYLPNHQMALAQTASSAMNILNSMRPEASQQRPLDPKMEVSQAAKSKYNQALTIAQQPLSVLSNIKNGTITPEQVILLNKMYPALYKSLSLKLLNSLNDTMSEGKSIPYETKMGLSIFMGQPMDSTMMPMAIMATQPKAMGGNSSQNVGLKPPPASSMKGLDKGFQSMMTPSQAREFSRFK